MMVDQAPFTNPGEQLAKVWGELKAGFAAGPEQPYKDDGDEALLALPLLWRPPGELAPLLVRLLAAISEVGEE